MTDAEKHVKVWTLTPENIPEFCEKTGEDLESVLAQYYRGKTMGLLPLLGYIAEENPWEPKIETGVDMDIREELKDVYQELTKQITQIKEDIFADSRSNALINVYAYKYSDGKYVLADLLVGQAQTLAALAYLEGKDGS